jgi:4-hydroxybenzoate polyprenyltransferase
MITFINKYLGWRNWAVFQYNSIFENLFVIFYIIIRNQFFSAGIFLDTVLFLLFSVFSTTYGYLINDFADVELDQKHGKPNTFANDSKVISILIITSVFALSVIAAVNFIGRREFLIAWIFWFLISTFYSLPPFRLKERGRIGLIFVVMAQRLIPILMVFFVFNLERLWEMILLGCYIFLRGTASDLNHQIDDFHKDASTSTQTSAVAMGLAHSQNLLRIVLTLEKIFLAVFLSSGLYFLASMNGLAYVFLTILVLLYLGALAYSVVIQFKSGSGVDINPFKIGDKNVFQFLHHAYPSVILPFGLNLIITPYQPLFGLILIFQLLMRRMFSIAYLKQSFIGQNFRKLQRNG